MEYKTQIIRKTLKIAYFAICLFGANCAHSATEFFTLYVDLNAIYKPGMTGFLADGSLVQIISSEDNVADGFWSINGSYVINSTTGDDELLASTTIGSGSPSSSGLFSWSFDLDTSYLNNYFYIRFFDYPASSIYTLNGPTNLYWGTSAVYLASAFDNGFFVELDFSTTSTNLVANQNNSFVVIPEPSSVSFFALVGGLALAMRSRLKRKKLD